MSNDQPTSRPAPSPSDVIPLPLALYESNGVIFELYRGGQPYQPVLIRWERLKTFAVTREGDLTFHVRVHQGQRLTTSE